MGDSSRKFEGGKTKLKKCNAAMVTSNKSNVTFCRKLHHLNSYGIFNGKNPLDAAFPLLLLELVTIITISHVFRLILKPLRQPNIIAQIMGGIIVGPSVLSRSKTFQKLYPDNSMYVARNIGLVGFMYFLFISGVKMDIFTIRKVDKRRWYIAIVGMVVPLVCSVAVSLVERQYMDETIRRASSIWGITSSLAISAFPVLYQVVREFNLISSEMGRMALSTAVISDVVGMIGVVIFEAWKQGEDKPIVAVWYLFSLIIVLATIICGLRQAMLWIVRTTPEGKPVEEIYVIMILLGVPIFGFIADMFGLAVCNGPLWLGLAVPDGPPLGAILVEKSETIMSYILMPFIYLHIGMIIDISAMCFHWAHLKPLLTIVLVGYTVKMIATFIMSRYLDLTLRDSLTLALLLSLRGEIELLLFLHWMDFKMIGPPHFTLLVLISMSITIFATPLINIIYDPMKPYMVNKRRNIQHTPPNTELHMVACLDGEESLYGFMKLLELSSPMTNSPFYIYALHHIELIGRANPVFIDHENEEEQAEQYSGSSVHNAIRKFQETRSEYLKIHCYTAITPKRTMYQDICELALSKQACLIIIPFHKDTTDNFNGVRSGKKQSCNSMTSSVLANAPCSVAILVDKSPYETIYTGIWRSSRHHFVILFLGGADAREALSYADRANGSGSISLTMIRFLSYENEGDDEMEKKLDDGQVTWFWVRNEGNTRFTYREVVVRNGEETIMAIQALNKDDYDLWIVGRKQGINPVLVQGLPNWRENTELGVIGDYISSNDFSSRASVLVVQQQILRGQKRSFGCSWYTKFR